MIPIKDPETGRIVFVERPPAVKFSKMMPVKDPKTGAIHYVEEEDVEGHRTGGLAHLERKTLSRKAILASLGG
jgi:hypothetical protein